MNNQSEFEIALTGFFDSKRRFPSLESGCASTPRTLSCYEIELMIEDGGTAFIDNSSFPIVKHHVLVAKPGQVRYSQLHYHVYYIHLNVYSDELKQQLDEVPNIFEISNEQNYLSIFEAILNASSSDYVGKSLYIKSKVYKLLYLLYTDSQKTLTNKALHNKKQLEFVREYIDKHYSEPLQLSDIATMANLSPIYFHKLFKTFYGQTPNNYLQEVRLSAAKSLLLTTNNTIENIALSCGFASHSYFNVVFKKTMNMSPLQFKQQELNKYKI